MNYPDQIVKQSAPATPVFNKRQFWKRAFISAIVIEAVYWVIHYFTQYNVCIGCLQPPAYYVIQWFLHAIFIGVVWLVLNSFYGKSKIVTVLLNIGVFIAHHATWIAMSYFLERTAPGWISRNHNNPISIYITISWFDAGKYVLVAGVFYALKFYAEYRHSEQQRMALTLINKDLQSDLLKQQLSPHFYFNTLNNLYGLARSNSPKLSIALGQLSNIMEYVIVECNELKVPLQREIDFLQSYIALEKLRYEENIVIDMEVEGTVNGHTILPLMLVQFVENAFKHGMKEKSEQNWMKVKMRIDHDEILFSVDNSYYETRPAEGIGLSSVRDCLNLQYDGKYDMQMNTAANRFSVLLKLNLS
ncbi:MAG: sensor histidine kinase [Chitinophagaceae bacterium]